jgi:hypothetical protein
MSDVLERLKGGADLYRQPVRAEETAWRGGDFMAVLELIKEVLGRTCGAKRAFVPDPIHVRCAGRINMNLKPSPRESWPVCSKLSAGLRQNTCNPWALYELLRRPSGLSLRYLKKLTHLGKSCDGRAFELIGRFGLPPASARNMRGSVACGKNGRNATETGNLAR